MRSTNLGRGRRYARRECNRGRAHQPARQAGGTATQRECMYGALVRFHDPRGLGHRLAEVLEPFGGISFTGDAGEDPEARAAMAGQAEAVITSRSGLDTPRWPAQRERLGVADGRRDPGRTPQSHIYRTRSGPRWCTTWLAVGGMPPELGPASSLLDPLRDHALVGTCGDAQLGRAFALASSSLPWRRARCPPPRPADPPGCPLPRGTRSPPRRFRARLAYASGHAAWLRRPGGQRADGQGRVRGDHGPSGRDRICMR